MAFNASPRNCTVLRSVSRKLRRIDRSTLVIPGARMLLRPPLPKVYCAGCANAVMSNHSFTDRFSDDRTGSRRTLARWFPAENAFVLLVFVVTVSGAPLWAVAI